MKSIARANSCLHLHEWLAYKIERDITGYLLKYVHQAGKQNKGIGSISMIWYKCVDMTDFN